MAVIFYYILRDDMYKIKEGISLEQCYDKSFLIDGRMQNCIIGLLSPKDDNVRYLSQEYICIEADVDIKCCYVLNGDLEILQDKELYYKSLIPLEEYKFGTYRRPQIAVTCNIPPYNIIISKKGIGTPILFNTSDQLYKDNIFEELRIRYDDFDETMLGIFFILMAGKQRMRVLGKKIMYDKTIYVYQDVNTKKIYTFDVQEGQNSK